MREICIPLGTGGGAGALRREMFSVGGFNALLVSGGFGCRATVYGRAGNASNTIIFQGILRRGLLLSGFVERVEILYRYNAGSLWTNPLAAFHRLRWLVSDVAGDVPALPSLVVRWQNASYSPGAGAFNAVYDCPLVCEGVDVSSNSAYNAAPGGRLADRVSVDSNAVESLVSSPVLSYIWAGSRWNPYFGERFERRQETISLAVAGAAGLPVGTVYELCLLWIV